MKKLISLLSVVFVSVGLSSAFAAEPKLIDYTSYPIFTVNPVKPNIMIIMDNSLSMNYPAYGSHPGGWGDAEIIDQPYSGVPYPPTYRYATMADSETAEQPVDDNITTTTFGELDLGVEDATGSANFVGLRFGDIDIPKDAVISNAHIQFTAENTDSTNVQIDIYGEKNPKPATFEDGVLNNISGRTKTTATVAWTPAFWTVTNDPYDTADLTAIVQELVNDPDWKSGRQMAFIFQNHTGNNNTRRAYSHSGTTVLARRPTLHIEYVSPDPIKYYGYFSPDWFYTYFSNKFRYAYKKVGYGTGTCAANEWEVLSRANVDSGSTTTECFSDAVIVSNSLYDGNWMNWASMRRIDVARKVMVGGLATPRTGSGSETLNVADPSGSNFFREFDSSAASAVTPYDGNYWYGFSNGYLYIDNDDDPFSSYETRMKIAIEKEYDYDPDSYVVLPDGTIEMGGVMQRIGEDKALWGNEFFLSGGEGGTIASTIGTNLVSMRNDLQNTDADAFTPLAESYYVAMQYFKQEQPDSALGYTNSAIGSTNNVKDPFYQDGEFVSCAKSFVILLTDGASTVDSQIPSAYKDYDTTDYDNTACTGGLYDANCDYPLGGTDYLDDIALYARTNDLRADLDGDQNLVLYPIYAFGSDPNARNLLWNAARNGGFKDKNGNNRPDGTVNDPAADRLEWDADGDENPDTYFEAKDGYKLEAKLLDAINDILKRAASGTAVSVLATSSEGEGNLVQAYFRPSVTSGTVEAKWLGYLQSLWVDAKGNLREDTNQDKKLDLYRDLTASPQVQPDNIITYFTDGSGNTKVNRYNMSTAADGELPYPDLDTTAMTPVEILLPDIKPVWEAGKNLAERDPDDTTTGRKIFTGIDTTLPLPIGTDLLYGGVEFKKLNSSLSSVQRDAIKPYLGVGNLTSWGYLGSTKDNQAENLINFIRGNDTGFTGATNLRKRTVTVGGSDLVWKLGDIVHSTPIAIDGPPESYGIIYQDQSYQEYETFYKNSSNRETVVYVGGNDGMMHAFTSWYYNPALMQFEAPPSAHVTEKVGDELWAYIPRALLPHLKWLADPLYTHVFFVDLQPKITDVRIFDVNNDTVINNADDDSTHINGWGTVLIGGLRQGGKAIAATDDFDYDTVNTTETFTSSYFAIDISNPRAPELLWERSFTDMGLTMNEPSIVKVGDKWFMVLGSGPETYEGTNTTSTRTGKIYIVDIATGNPYQNGTNDWLFETVIDPGVDEQLNAFMTTAASVDKGSTSQLNYNVDGIYIGATYNDAGWKGAMYKITVPWLCSDTPANCSSFDNYYGDLLHGAYIDNPVDATTPWYLSKIFASPGPITAPPAISVDQYDNVWVYFGTGRYLSNADKADKTPQYLMGIKDPFFNSDHTPGGIYDGSYTYDYYHDPHSLTLTQSHLFDADIYKFIYPWGHYDVPGGDCSSVPTGQVGDIFATTDPGNCVCSYDWPEVVCSEAAPAAADNCASIGVTLGPQLLAGPPILYAADKLESNTNCVCQTFQKPDWVCGGAGCATLPEGVVGTVLIPLGSAYNAFYRQCTGDNETSCDNVGATFTGNYYNDPGAGGDGSYCDCVKVTAPAYHCDERVAGFCSAASPPFVFGDEGDQFVNRTDDSAGYCRTGYWACEDLVTDGCSLQNAGTGVNFAEEDATVFLGPLLDGDYGNNDECQCHFVAEPVGRVDTTTGIEGLTFNGVLEAAQAKDGWIRTLPDPGERMITKPAVLGGLAIFSTYVPSDDTCAFGGFSYLWGLYYETGTAYGKSFDDFNPSVPERVYLGLGKASSVGIHVGTQEGNKASTFVQLSTGVIKDNKVDPPFKIRSGYEYWQEN
jgi:type IV pilus assembly protein PilY1